MPGACGARLGNELLSCGTVTSKGCLLAWARELVVYLQKECVVDKQQPVSLPINIGPLLKRSSVPLELFWKFSAGAIATTRVEWSDKDVIPRKCTPTLRHPPDFASDPVVANWINGRRRLQRENAYEGHADPHRATEALSNTTPCDSRENIVKKRRVADPRTVDGHCLQTMFTDISTSGDNSSADRIDETCLPTSSSDHQDEPTSADRLDEMCPPSSPGDQQDEPIDDPPAAMSHTCVLHPKCVNA